MSRRYVLITPCRDEAQYLPITIDCVARQTVPPAKWLVVDDGSTDDTPRILAEAKQRLAYLEVIRREDRGRRSVGPGVIQAFNEGLSHVDLDEYDYVSKFDGDLEFQPQYFQRVMERFEEDPFLGTFSGKLYLRQDGRLVHERCGDENSVGPCKFFRVECFRDIGGFVPQVCWDGIDGHLARLNGWVARSEDDPEMRLIHLRQMGTSHRGLWTGRLRWGGGKYYMGSSLPYMLAVGLYRSFEKPYVISGLGILWGYLRAMARGEDRYKHREYRRLLRRYEWAALLRGKGRVTRELHDEIRRTGARGGAHDNAHEPVSGSSSPAPLCAER